MSLDRIIIMACGLPGSGKSETTEWLANQLEYTWCSQDKIRQEIKQTAYNQKLNSKVRRILNRRITQSLEQNQSVVIDRGYGEKKSRDALYDKVARYDPTIVLVEFYCTNSTAKARMLRRPPPGHIFSPSPDPLVYSQEIKLWQDPRKDLETHPDLSYLQYDTQHSQIKELCVREKARPIVDIVEKMIGQYCITQGYQTLTVSR